MEMEARKFKRFMEAENEKEYMLRIITYAISPTIAGCKPSSIISISNKNRGMFDLWCIYGDEYINNINMNAFEIVRKDGGIIILFYRKEVLKNYLKQQDNKYFLSQYGYDVDKPLDESLELLKERYNKFNCPHEMGIFLGIPSEDVEAFIKCNGRDCRYCGYWKVYHNLHNALETFKEYDDSKNNFLKLLKNNIGVLKAVELLALTR